MTVSIPADPHAAWLVRHELVPESALESYRSYALPDLIDLSYPGARGGDRDLLVDILGWFTIMDDHFDGPLGRDVTGARGLVGRFRRVLTVPDVPPAVTGSPQDGVVRAWHDLWQRQRRPMTGAWCRHAVGEWATCLETFVAETSHRALDTLPSLREATRLRRHASCLYPFMNMLELVQGSEIPARLRAEPDLRRLRANTADAATLVNDLFSLEWEERAQNPFNMVVILRQTHGLSRTESIAAVRAHIRRLMADSENLRERLAPRYPEARWYLAGTRQLVIGVHAWAGNTRRYADSV
ncbi:terpene synthase family protein [Streptomyces sp. SBT349]|uniref:terpene synthase family protein n=1 Tax=Streptomyces sp. SBT349 TaxID=1580539 RepID=UPI00066B5EB3|nr:terpene synthase family protein [Streptomyces sp. SBT349]